MATNRCDKMAMAAVYELHRRDDHGLQERNKNNKIRKVIVGTNLVS
jgi:hypothetical protein